MIETHVKEKMATYQHTHPGGFYIIICDGVVLIENKAAFYAAGITVELSDALHIHVAQNTVVEKPLHLIFLTTGQEANITPIAQRITLAHHSQLSLIEAYISLTMNNQQAFVVQTQTTVSLQANAMLHYYKTQEEMLANRLKTAVIIDQAAHSHARLLHLLKSCFFAQHQVVVNLKGEHAYCHASGFAETTQDDHHIEQQIEINHVGQHSQSDLYYKGLLDKKSSMRFNGRVHVAKDAQKSSAYQENHHLLLSTQAEVYTKPELEIYADDITCKHGATVGEIDEEALFYLQSRGIRREQAVGMLIQGFANDIFKHIHLPSLLALVDNEVRDVS